LREEWEKQKALSNLSSLVPKKHRHGYPDTTFAEDMSLVTDNNVKNDQNILYVNQLNTEGQTGNIPSPDKLPPSIIDSLKKLEVKNKVVSKQ
ncbi:32056_t:CDS:1, partial [Racocetra persica]